MLLDASKEMPKAGRASYEMIFDTVAALDGLDWNAKALI